MPNLFYRNHSPFKISEILKLLNIKFDNVFSDKDVLDIKDLSNANENEITFLHSKKYSEIAKKTNASFCITTNLLKNYLPKSCVPILVENVLVATSKVTSQFYPESVNDHFDDTEWISVTRKLRENYRVSGKDGKLDRALPKNAFPRSIIEYIKQNLKKNKPKKKSSWFKRFINKKTPDDLI